MTPRVLPRVQQKADALCAYKSHCPGVNSMTRCKASNGQRAGRVYARLSSSAEHDSTSGRWRWHLAMPIVASSSAARSSFYKTPPLRKDVRAQQRLELRENFPHTQKLICNDRSMLVLDRRNGLVRHFGSFRHRLPVNAQTPICLRRPACWPVPGSLGVILPENSGVRSVCARARALC